MLDTSSTALIDLLKNALAVSNPDFVNQISEITDEHERSGKPIIEIIENFGIMSEDDTLELIAESLGTVVWDFKLADISHKVIEMVDDNTARSYGIIPVDFEDDMLKIAVKDPFDFQTLDSLSFLLGHPIQAVVCKIDQLERALNRYYPEREEDINSIIEEMGYKEFDADSDVRDLEDAANEFAESGKEIAKEGGLCNAALFDAELECQAATALNATTQSHIAGGGCAPVPIPGVVATFF